MLLLIFYSALVNFHIHLFNLFLSIYSILIDFFLVRINQIFKIQLFTLLKNPISLFMNLISIYKVTEWSDHDIYFIFFVFRKFY